MKKAKLNTLKVGDIIWAKRYSSKKQEQSIPIGHREGPFLIIKKTPKRIYSLSITSKEWSGYKLLKVKISRISEQTLKDSYVFIGKTYKITKDNYLYKIGKLNLTNLNIIKKQLYLLEQTSYNDKIKGIKIKPNEITISKGDIITYNNEYLYVKCIRKDNIYCNHLSLSNSKDSLIINGIKYRIDYKSKIIIKKSYNYKFVNIVNLETRNLITENLKSSYIPEIGKVIQYDNELYYIYNENNIYFKTIKIYKDNNNYKEELIINNKSYYTNFELNNISIYENLEVITIAHNIEINNIKNRIIINNESPQKGYIINLKEELYYIYSDQGYKFNTYKLYTGIPEKGMRPVILSNKGYFTRFELSTISKNEKFISLNIANDTESKNFREALLKNKNKKELVENSNNKAKELKKYYSIKKIVLDNETMERYVVLYNSNYYIKLVNINDYSDYHNINLKTIDYDRYEVVSEIEHSIWKNIRLLNSLRKN